MKLSSKLKISFCVLILVPVILFSMALLSLTAFQIKEINTNYNTNSTSYKTLTNPVMLVSNICESEISKLETSAEESPEDYEDYDYLNNINSELSKRCAFLIIVEDGRCKYAGKDGSLDILQELEEVDYGENTKAGIYLGGNYQVLINQVTYTTEWGGDGTAYVVMQIKELVPQMKRLLLDCLIAVILILILTSAIFTTWIYKETVSPINKLKLATYNIKNGNLDFDMNVKGKDEISELCRDFDDMRARLKENAEEKVKADAESKELISNISHDLKTPITAIKGYVEGIMDGVADTDEKMDRYIKTIYNKACDMDRLINELTFYSKVDSNKVVYNFTKLNISDYFDDCTEELGMDLDASGIELKYENELEPGTIIVADTEQLKRVINNIISNSVKYMDTDKGCITIHLKDLGRKVEIDIGDNGKGISAEDVPYIFDRFYRTDTSRNSAKGGSGIGLSIVKKIITDHGGTITAQSAPGEGTTMHIIFDKYVKDIQQTMRITDGKGDK